METSFGLVKLTAIFSYLIDETRQPVGFKIAFYLLLEKSVFSLTLTV